jgi:hypothetical protein
LVVKTHCCPTLHAAPAPQPQVPSPRQVFEVVLLQLAQAVPLAPHEPLTGGATHVAPWQQPVGQDVESQTQRPISQRWPSAHGVVLPHLHAPSVHWSERWSHAAHAAPPAPHCETVAVTQLAPAQHPVHVMPQP